MIDDLKSIISVLKIVPVFFNNIGKALPTLAEQWKALGYKRVINSLDDIYFFEAETVSKLRAIAGGKPISNADLVELQQNFLDPGWEMRNAIAQLTTDENRRRFGYDKKLVDSLHGASEAKKKIRGDIAAVLRASKERGLSANEQKSLKAVVEAIERLNAEIIRLRKAVVEFEAKSGKKKKTPRKVKPKAVQQRR